MGEEHSSTDRAMRPICPNCGSRNVAWIQWGYPIWSDSLRDKMDRRETVLGGCCVSESSERWECNDCGHRFGNIGAEILVRKAKGEDVPDHIAAHDYCISNETLLKQSRVCACFYCEQFFTPDQIEEWIDDIHDTKTALCPYCGVDAVLGDAMEYPLTEELIRKMYWHWFGW